MILEEIVLAERYSSKIRLFGKWLQPLFVILAALATIAGASIFVLIGASVAMRYMANTPFRFTEELVGLLMTAAFFLVLPLITLHAKHVRVVMLLAYLPNRVRLWVNIFGGLLGLAFCLWFFALCLPWLEFAFERNIKTEVGRLIMYPWMTLMPLSMILSGMAFILRAFAVDNGIS